MVVDRALAALADPALYPAGAALFAADGAEIEAGAAGRRAGRARPRAAATRRSSCTPPERPASRRAPCTGTSTCPSPRSATRSGVLGLRRRRPRALRREALLRLRPGQRAHLSAPARRRGRAAAPSGPRPKRCSSCCGERGRPCSSACRPCTRRCSRTRSCPPTSVAYGSASRRARRCRRRSAERWRARFGVEILDGLGSTEMLHIFVSNRPGAVRPGSSGVPVPGYEVRLVDGDGPRRCPTARSASSARARRERGAQLPRAARRDARAPCSRRAGCAPATAIGAIRTAATGTWGAATTS